MAQIAILGGTGPEGLGLAARFALAGEQVVIGSREPDRAERAAEALQRRLARGGRNVHIHGAENRIAASEADHVALTLPFAAVATTLENVAPALADKIILDVVNPVVVRSGVFELRTVPAGSAGEMIQQLLPRSHVVSGFKHLSAAALGQLEKPLYGDVVLCSDTPQATRLFADLIRRIPHLRPIDAGALVTCKHLESLTALLLNLNRRYNAATSIKILGLDPDSDDRSGSASPGSNPASGPMGAA